jgi:hypothetical protein
MNEGDYGLSRPLGLSMTTNAGTEFVFVYLFVYSFNKMMNKNRGYRAPEILDGGRCVKNEIEKVDKIIY